MKEFNFKTFAQLLVGTWKGEGKGIFPTINSFEYIECLKFECDYERSIIHYEQKTWIKPSLSNKQKSSHWESGFISFENDKHRFMNNVHAMGRMESLSLGKLEKKQGIYTLDFNSKFIKNDERILSSDRTWHFDSLNSSMFYEMSMSTSKVKDNQLHLRANLLKETLK